MEWKKLTCKGKTLLVPANSHSLHSNESHKHCHGIAQARSRDGKMHPHYSHCYYTICDHNTKLYKDPYIHLPVWCFNMQWLKTIHSTFRCFIHVLFISIPETFFNLLSTMKGNISAEGMKWTSEAGGNSETRKRVTWAYINLPFIQRQRMEEHRKKADGNGVVKK